MNILILSVGTRNKIVQYFRNNLKGGGKVICTDNSKLAPAIYEADKYYIVPKIDDPNYLDRLFEICKIEHIDGVLSLIDPELSLLAKHAEDFRQFGVTVVGSSYELCEMSLDKMQMYHWLIDHGYNAARSYDDSSDFYSDLSMSSVNFPVFVKPVRGSASLFISKVFDSSTLDLLLSNDNDLMIQEFLDGQEIGADVYIDMLSGEVISIFTKKKLKMRAGETDKAISFKDPRLFDLVEKFVKEAGYRGQIDIDIFEIDGKYYISEVNPRFGGGYPHAYESGCNHIRMILENLAGHSNQRSIGEYNDEIVMMKYNEIMILPIGN